ncbi:hypothetical protein D3C85_1162450 [compost metagenome]
MEDDVASSSVYPSAGALATNSVPIIDAAPGRFSTMKAVASLFESCSARARAIKSVAPPAGKGTISWTARSDTAACAECAAKASVTIPPIRACLRNWIARFFI